MFGGGGLLCDLLVNPLDSLDELVLRTSGAKVTCSNFNTPPDGWKRVPYVALGLFFRSTYFFWEHRYPEEIVMVEI